MRVMVEDPDRPWWLRDINICGYEGEGDAGAGDSGEDAGAGDEGDEGDEGEGSGASDDDKDTYSKEDVAGLKSALNKERTAAKKATRELRTAQKQLEAVADKDKTEVQRATEAEKKAAERVAKLGERLRMSAVDSAIEREARKLNFRDPDDALHLVTRSEIEIDQDEDDPASIDIDRKSVERAVKALAEKKPHLLLADGEQTPSGSKFAGGSKDKDKLTAEALQAKYPSLRG